MPEVDEFNDYDKYINAEVLLPVDGEHMGSAKVMSRAKDTDGIVAGAQNDNPMLDTRVYNVMFPNGAKRQYSANVNAQSMYANVDEDGHQYQLMDEIIEHRKDGTAVAVNDSFTFSTAKNGKSVGSRKMTTKGWFLRVRWKDGSDSWAKLKDIKDSTPVELAEYAVTNGIAHEPAFAWWVPYTLKKRDRVIAGVDARKYG